MKKSYKGSCLCGVITYEAIGFSQLAAHCHCTMCRKFHGAAFGTMVAVEELYWLTGKALLKEYQAPNGTIRSFCSECGSSIGFREAGSSFDSMEIAIASFDETIPVCVDANIYTNYKVPWCKIALELKNYPEGRSKDLY